MKSVVLIRAGLIQMAILATISVVPVKALVLTSVSVNGVQLVSEAESLSWGLPSSLNISRVNGSFLFNFTLATDPSQNPDEATLGDSFAVSFFSNPGNLLQIPNDYASQKYFTDNNSASFSRQFTADGIFDGGFSVMMSNSISAYRSFFSGYEANPVFHFNLYNNRVTALSTDPPPTGSVGTPASDPGPGPSNGTVSPSMQTPEPGTFGLMLGGGLLLAQFRRGRSISNP